MDVRSGEVPNGVWFLGLAALPLGLFRLLMGGLVLLYSLQLLLEFTLVVFCFSVSILGGADGKAILVVSLVYPWLEINLIILVFAPILIFTGAFFIVGVQCIVITLLNVVKHRQYSSQEKNSFKPSSRRYWFTRRISEDSIEAGEGIWRKVSVPLVLYFLITYLALLFYQTLL
jgi:Flp pilus assembly protein protease CpaA